MKKTLLIAAAALAAGVISSQAQVYSLNVVGYVNTTIAAGHYQIIGSDMNNGTDANQTNGDVNALLVNGSLVSSPSLTPQNSTNTTLLYWNGTGFQNFYYYNSNDASTMEGDAPGTDPAGYYDNVGDFENGNLLLGQNHSAFIFNHWSGPITVTSVGTVQQGTNISTINAGYNLVEIQEPVGISSSNLVVNSTGGQNPFGLPLNMTSSPTLSPTLTTQDVMLYWNGTGFQSFFYYNSNDASSMEGDSPGTDVAGFYDNVGDAMFTIVPTVSANQGFFIHHIGAAISWTNSFTVQ
jgi:hypothetical protein